MSTLLQAGQQRPRRRTPTPGPELDFVEAALASASTSGLWRGEEPIFFREPALPTGFPDLVGVVPRREELLFQPERLELRGEHLKLLHYIFSARGTTARAAADALLWNEQTLQAMIDELELAALVRRSRHQVRCMALAKVFIAKRIIAIEAKLDKWEDAIRQAVANTWFASHSFVLLPDKRWRPEVRQTAARFRVGVMTYDGSHIRVRLRAPRRRIPASYGSWLVNEWTVRFTASPAG